MKCPICKADLSPLDLYSRTEHVDSCIENGPSILDYNQTGQLVLVKTGAKQRKICPICDKTFQSLHQHFRKCASKNDVPPNLLLEYWEKINTDSSKPKNFPRELLDDFIAKCVRDRRVGEQVDFARALLLSMGYDDSAGIESSSNNVQNNEAVITPTEGGLGQDSTTSHGGAGPSVTSDASEILVQNVSTAANFTANKPGRRAKPAAVQPKFRLELTNDETKESNILLRVDRELAATREKRYREYLRAEAANRATTLLNGETHDENDECTVLDDDIVLLEQYTPAFDDHMKRVDEQVDTTLFFRARLKNCTKSEKCSSGTCLGHDLVFTVDGFEPYTGKSIYEPTKQVAEHQSTENKDEVISE